MSIGKCKLKSRHYDIHYYENSISGYQLISKELYQLIVLIIYMIHYLASADIKSVVQRE